MLAMTLAASAVIHWSVLEQETVIFAPRVPLCQAYGVLDMGGPHGDSLQREGEQRSDSRQAQRLRTPWGSSGSYGTFGLRQDNLT
jgi:hypothetical protein